MIKYKIKLDSLYIWNNKVFNYEEFNNISFNKFIMENLYLNSTYSILIKFGFAKDNTY